MWTISEVGEVDLISCRTEDNEVVSLPGAGFWFSVSLSDFGASLVHIGSCCGVLEVLEDRSFSDSLSGRS